MSHGEPGDTCHFGHVFRVYDYDEDKEGPGGGEIRDQIRSGEIKDLDDLKKEMESELPDPSFLRPIMGDHYKRLKVAAGSQGTPYLVSWLCADKLDEDNHYEVSKTQEKIYVSPQSNVHGEMTQRKQQAEQNVKQTMQGYQQLKKQKHMLEHDIRKLRSRAEAFESGDETQLKGDFIELVDGAGAGGQQGGDEAALKFYRDNNIYPSIVADFNEMDSVDDLTGDGHLADLPENEKAILKKKYTMYEKWKDLYGSEIHRKLNDLKAELNRIERSIEETEEWLAPYVRDLEMINQESQEEMAEHLSNYFTLTGTSTMFRNMEFIAYRPLKNEGELKVIDDEEEATHFRIIYIHSVHVNLASPEQPQTPAEGPSAAEVYWFPAIVCRHVWENIFKEKIDMRKEQYKDLMDDYTGDFEPSDAGKKLKDARTAENMSVRDLRARISEEVDEEPPIRLSASIRRIEDGLDDFSAIEEEFESGKDYVEAIKDILEIEFEDTEEDSDMYQGVEKTLRNFTGQVDEFVIDEDNAMTQLQNEMKFKYYWDFKLDIGLNTMK